MSTFVNILLILKMTLENPIILFDGVCNLCNSSVQFIIKRDKKALFKFASLQSEEGQRILKKFNLPVDQINTIILTDDSNFWSKSTAALKIATKLSGLWPMMYAFILIPKLLRDKVYEFIARNRYRWFGKQESCWIPSPELKARFI